MNAKNSFVGWAKQFQTYLVLYMMIASCGEKKECPGFGDNLTPYIPNESRLVFHNAAGDSLVFNTKNYDKTPARTEKQNALSVGGSGSKPYCRSACSLSAETATQDAQNLSYSINVDNEALSCTLEINMASAIPSNDYFQHITTFSPEGKLFGDTLKLTNYIPTTAPRFSMAELVYGRGIVRLQDDVKKCVWVR
jgi:hypothetical protein